MCEAIIFALCLPKVLQTVTCITVQSYPPAFPSLVPNPSPPPFVLVCDDETTGMFFGLNVWRAGAK